MSRANEFNEEPIPVMGLVIFVIVEVMAYHTWDNSPRLPHKTEREIWI